MTGTKLGRAWTSEDNFAAIFPQGCYYCATVSTKRKTLRLKR